jgi:hypothetical protein
VLESVSTHALADAQYFCPVTGHTQVPEPQISVGLQIVPQVPQFDVSVCRLTHAPATSQ